MGIFTRKIRLVVTNIYYATRSIFWKKDSKVVLFGAWFGDKFADNSRFLFHYLSSNKEKLGLSHVIWVTRKKDLVGEMKKLGYEACLLDAKEGKEYHKIAKYHIICNSAENADDIKSDIDTNFSWRAIRVNLWHGVLSVKGVASESVQYMELKNKHPFIIGLKEMLYRNRFFRLATAAPGGWGDCFYLTTTEYTKNAKMKSTGLPSRNIIVSGYPRVSGTVEFLENEKSILKLMSNYTKIIMYFPTFRDSDTFDFYALSRAISSYLKAENILLIQKFHSASKAKDDELVCTNNIVHLPSEFDLNSIISYASLVITDYSGAIGDALCFNIPVLYYVPDIETYATNDRGFTDDPQKIMCGPIVQDASNLVRTIKSVIEKPFMPDSKYLDIREQFYGSPRSMKKIWDDILEQTSN